MKIEELNGKIVTISKTSVKFYTDYAERIRRATQPIELEKIIYNVVFDERLTYGDCMQVTGIARYRLQEMKQRIADEQRRAMARNIARIEA